MWLNVIIRCCLDLVGQLQYKEYISKERKEKDKTMSSDDLYGFLFYFTQKKKIH